MIRYRTLFEVEIAHDYFLSRDSIVFEAQPESLRSALASVYSTRRFLEIFPDDATRATLAGHKMIFRASDGGLVVAAQLDASATDIRPAIPLAADFKLTFAMRIREAQFANYTELGAQPAGFLRFGNDSQNHVAGTSYLSRPIPAFSATRRYVAGDTRTQAAGPTFDLFLAVRDTGPSAMPVAADWRRIPADTFDPTETYQAGAVVLSQNRLFRAVVDNPGTNLADVTKWQAAGILGNQYVSAADGVPAVPALFILDLTASALPRATIRLFRAGQTAVASEQTFEAPQGLLGSAQVDLRGLVPGLYRYEILDSALVVVPGGVNAIYFSPAARRGGWFGVIEIGAGAGDFALLAGDGTLRTPRYVLRFLNRATRWRYIFPAAQAAGTGADVLLESGSDRRLVTAVPRALTRFGTGPRLQADDATTATTSEEILLPAPEPNRIRRQSAEWFSETHLPNITVGP